MKAVYIFDIDGTLTRPRQRMAAGFADRFATFCQRWPVYLASGSDYLKITEQVPEAVIARVRGIFPCAGAEFWQRSRCVYAEDHQFPAGLIELVQTLLAVSPYPHRFGAHIEKRTGMLNVSVVGRGANPQQRHDYAVWDERQGERAAMAEVVAELYPAYEYAISGDISIDICPKGANKARILRTLDRLYPNGSYRFFGDRTKPGGNDWPLVRALALRGGEHRVFAVDSCDETEGLLDGIARGFELPPTVVPLRRPRSAAHSPASEFERRRA